MPEWDAEVQVDERLARALIRATHPTLDTRALRLLGTGWDNTVWVTADGIVFRFPRREIALPGIHREMTVLTQLAPRLPFPIPDAAYPGEPSDLFPWPWFGSHLIPGHEIHERQLPQDNTEQLAHDLGAFLTTLHRLALPEPADLPTDPNSRADMPARVPRARAALRQLDPSGALAAQAGEILDAAESLPWSDALVLTHGDLHFRHTLINGYGGLAGIIDWGDICRSAAGIDLSLYWSLFLPPARAAFRHSYGQISESNLTRARVLALSLCALLANYARDQNMPGVERQALQGIKRTLID